MVLVEVSKGVSLWCSWKEIDEFRQISNPGSTTRRAYLESEAEASSPYTKISL